MRMVSVGRHRLAATVLGEGAPAVVIEPSFGGCAEDWTEIAETLSAETTVVLYDRVPYGASSAARDARTPAAIAADLDGLLRELAVTGPLVLVGHSAGGIYVRAYAAAHLDRVAGLVLVESSHEGQRPVLDPLRSRRNKLDAALTIPAIIRESRQSRRGGDRWSVIREFRTFNKVTAGQPPLPPGGLGDRPLVVLTCSPGNPAVPVPVWQGWHGLHRDLAALSANSRHVVSPSDDHYLNFGDPGLVTASIRDVVRCARSGESLASLPDLASVVAPSAGVPSPDALSPDFRGAAILGPGVPSAAVPSPVVVSGPAVPDPAVPGPVVPSAGASDAD
jgi:pimeloyl-ACP methyl ester carboxylesterase